MSLLFDHVRLMLKKSWLMLVFSTLLVWFFLFLFHIFFWLYRQTSVLSDTVTEKLWMYFYVDEWGLADGNYDKVLELQNKLEYYGMDVSFTSKQDALDGLFGRSNPELIERMEANGLGNPLPATLYVVFDDEKELDILKKLMFSYKDVIANVDDVTYTQTLKEQEKRNVTAISLSQFLSRFGLVVVVVLWLGIFALLLFVLQRLFVLMDETIEVKLLLWARMSQIIFPFVVVLVFCLFCAFAFALVLLLWGLWLVEWQIVSILWTDVWMTYFRSFTDTVFSLLGWELLWLIVLASFFAWFSVRKMVLAKR